MDFYRLLWTRLVPERYALACVGNRGGTAFKIWVKTRKIVVRPDCFETALKFFTRVEGGGSEAPIRRMACWGLLANRHGTSFIKFKFNPRVCFYDYFLHSRTGHRT